MNYHAFVIPLPVKEAIKIFRERNGTEPVALWLNPVWEERERAWADAEIPVVWSIHVPAHLMYLQIDREDG